MPRELDRAYREEVLELLAEAKEDLGNDTYAELLDDLIDDLEGYREEVDDESED